MTLDDGAVTVEVPAGAVTADITLTAAAATTAPASDLAVTGGAVDLGPEGTTFAAPVTINLTYAEADLPAGVDESELRMFKSVDDAWELLETTSVDAATNTVSGETSSFSIYGMLGLEVDGVTVTPATAGVTVGSTVALTGTAVSGSTELPHRSLTWSTDDAAVATVDDMGVVTGVMGGTATITATHTSGESTFSATATVTVTVPVTTVTVAPATSDLLVDETVQLTGTTLGPGNEDLGRTIMWSSSGEAVATVDANGLVTAVGIGTATITATSDGVSGTATVNVTDPVTTVTVVAQGAAPEDDSPILTVAGTVQLEATATRASGADASGDPTTWMSSDEAVATVDDMGLVTAVASGMATITATVDGVEGSEMVTVNTGIASLVGRYEGAWVDNTFATTGTASFVIALDAGVLTVMSDLNGFVYGIQDYPEETWTADFDPSSVTFNEASATFGTLTLTVNADGSVTAEGLGAGGFTKVTWTGTIDQDTINLTWMLYTGATATVFGTHILNKVP